MLSPTKDNIPLGTESASDSRPKRMAPQTERAPASTSSDIDPSTTALIIIDVQPEYWSSSPYAPYEKFPHFPSSISSLIHTCRNKHDFRKIIWIRADYQHEHKKSLFLTEFEKLHGPNHVYPSITPSESLSSLEWEKFAHPNLTDGPGGKEVVIPKPSICATTSTSLVSLLTQLGVQTAVVAGLITSVCVHHSAFGLFESGLRTIVVEDACADREKIRHDMTLQLYGRYCYEVMRVSEVKLRMEKSNTSAFHDVIREPLEHEEHVISGDDRDDFSVCRSPKKRKVVTTRRSGRLRTVSVSN